MPMASKQIIKLLESNGFVEIRQKGSHKIIKNVFEAEENGSYSVFFPDVIGCNTCANNLQEAYDMAFDALGIMLTYFEEESLPIPEPSDPIDVQLEQNQFIAIIRFDYIEYKKKVSTKAVKKNFIHSRMVERGSLTGKY